MSLYGEMAKVLDRSLELSEFELQLQYYVHFRIITLARGINSLKFQALR